MQGFNLGRTEATGDELWLCEHPPVFTLGLAADRTHVLSPGDIPIVPIDRGGQVTYHGPGQLMVYPLLNVRRLGLGVRALVMALEQGVVELAAKSGVTAAGRRDAPGVYVDGAKIASIGLRIRRSCSYHGMAVNVAMDTTPFARINPCGMAGLEVSDLARLGVVDSLPEAARRLLPELAESLGLAFTIDPESPVP